MKKDNKPDFFEHPAEEMLWEWMHGFDQRVLDHLNNVTPMEAACLMVEFMGYAIAKNVGYGVVKRLSETLATQSDAAVMRRQVQDAMQGQHVQDLSTPKPLIMEAHPDGMVTIYSDRPTLVYVVDTEGVLPVTSVLAHVTDMDRAVKAMRAAHPIDKYPPSLYQRETGASDLSGYAAWREARQNNDPDWLLNNLS